jgi:hypothetical protein
VIAAFLAHAGGVDAAGRDESTHAGERNNDGRKSHAQISTSSK